MRARNLHIRTTLAVATAWLCLAACTLIAPLETPRGTSIPSDRGADEDAGVTGPSSSSTCSPLASGCPTRQTCAPDATSAGFQLTCQASEGLPRGAPCGERFAACAPGLLCSADGLCVKACKSDADCEAASAPSCHPYRFRGIETSLRVCDHACDPVHPQNPKAGLQSCPDNYGCYLGADLKSATCVATTAHHNDGERCASDPECLPGSSCSDGVCARYCRSESDCPSIGIEHAPCLPGLSSVSICGMPCDPLSPQTPRAPLSACGDGMTCALVPGEPKPHTECVPAGAASEGADCNTDRDCAAGLVCFDDQRCRRRCSEDADCAQDTRCYLGDPVALTTLKQGVCATGCNLVAPQTQRDEKAACAATAGCHPVSLGGPTACVANTDRRAIGARCDRDSQCDHGSGCLDVACNAYCASDADCRDSQHVAAPCLQKILDAGDNGRFCAVMCDPIAAASPRAMLRACGAGLSCHFFRETGATDCFETGPNAGGGTCTSSADCAAGLVCDVGLQRCTPYCSTQADCPGATQCAPLRGISGTGYSIGYCAP